MKASKKRSAAKSGTWRFVAVILTFIVLWAVMGFHESLFWTVIIHVVKTGLYYIHERIWSQIKWGYES